MADRLTGLIAATLTPMSPAGGLRTDLARPMVDYLVSVGVTGLYVAGSTGEGMSLTGAERKAVAEAYIQASAGRLPVVVQVGHNSLAEARGLAEHARAAGADVISATSPSYFKPNSVESLVDCMAEIAAAAPDTPFYYYHIPRLTAAEMDMLEFLRLGGRRIPNLAGIKYSALTVFEYQECLAFDDGRFDLLWGCDEMLLSALAVGARGAVGSTYNLMAPLYNRIIERFDAGDLAEARRGQLLAARIVRVLIRHGLHASMKAVLKMLGLAPGPCRKPLATLNADQTAALRADLDALNFFDWAPPAG